MKKGIFLLSMLGLANCAYAINHGFYVGGGAGYGILRTPDENVFLVTAPTNTQNTNQRGGWAGRAFLGLNFSPYFGVEAGYARYARSRYAATESNVTSSIRYYADAADLVGKLYLPIQMEKVCTNLYILGGAAYYLETLKYADAGIPVVNITPPPVGTTNVYTVRPIYGAGFNVIPTCYLTIGVEFTRIQGTGNFNTDYRSAPNADLGTVNVAYNFG